MPGARGSAGQRHHGSVLLGGLSKVFEFHASGLNWRRGVMFLDVALVPLLVFWSIGHQEYLLSAVAGALLSALVDPGGGYRYRAARIAAFALAGAAVTAIGFGLSGSAWGWFVLASFVGTLLAGLAVTFGTHRFVAGLVLNLWLIIAIAFGASLHLHVHITSYTWVQVLAWVGGSTLWLVVVSIAWLVGGRKDVARPIAELPGDTTRRRLTRPLALFAVVRAVAIAGSVAIAFGLSLSHAYWLPVATTIAMKPSLAQTTLVSAQRVIGALIGGATAVLLLLMPASTHGLALFRMERGMELLAIVLLMHAVAVRFWNYTIYTGAIAAGVLILEDLGQPTNYSAEADRVFWTLAGVAIGVAVMALAGLLGKRGNTSKS